MDDLRSRRRTSETQKTRQYATHDGHLRSPVGTSGSLNWKQSFLTRPEIQDRKTSNSRLRFTHLIKTAVNFVQNFLVFCTPTGAHHGKVQSFKVDERDGTIR